jgi:hypothetical protein
VISVLPALLAQAMPEVDPSTVARLLIVLMATLVGLLAIRLLISVVRFFAIAAVGLFRLVISRVLLLVVALVLLVGVLTGSTGLADSLWSGDGPQPDPPIARRRQDGHIKGTPEYRERLRLGKPTSRWDDPTEADPLTREAWRNGATVPGSRRVRDWDAGRRVGAAADGGSLTHIRVSRDRQGRIYGWPAG